jgi:ankyrin repeat protein
MEDNLDNEKNNISKTPVLPALLELNDEIDEKRKVAYENGKFQEIFETINLYKNDLKKFDSKGGFPLGRICENKSLNETDACKLVTFFIENGAQVQTQHRKTGKTALHLAAVNNRAEIMRILLDKGALIDERDTTRVGATPLIFASSFPGNIDAIKLLIKRGANINAVTKEDSVTDSGGRMTALHWAAQEGLIDYVKEFIKAGANKELKTQKGKSIIDCLTSAKLFNKISASAYQEVVKILSIRNVNTDELEKKLSGLNLDSNPNPLQDSILGDNIHQVSEMLNNDNLTQSQIKLGLKDAVHNDKYRLIALFKNKLPKKDVLEVIDEQIQRITEIREKKYRELSSYEGEGDFDLLHGDWADRAQELMNKNNFYASGRNISVKKDIENTQSAISSLSYTISELNKIRLSLLEAEEKKED